jgi:cytochrome c553
MLLVSVAFAVEPAAPSATGSIVRPPAAAQMHQRYDRLEAIRDAVEGGDLGAARAAAKVMARAKSGSLPAEWSGHLSSVRTESRAVVKAGDLVAAADGTARIADACAECHAATGGGPQHAQLASIPAQDWTEGANMKLHAWAVDVMWLGLLARSDEAWTRGASELSREPIPLRFPEPPLQEGRTQLELRLYVLAGRALTLNDPGERATLYGQMMATCAECHVAEAR